MRLNILNIKKKIIIRLTLALAVISFTTLSSCNKWLELKPEDGLIEQDYWHTKEQLKAAVMGCYASLLDGSSMPLTKYLFMWGELRGDMVKVGFAVNDDDDMTGLSNLSRDQLSMIRTEIDSKNSIVNWEAIYKTINNCNDVIKNAELVLKTDKTITRGQLEEYLAEVYGLRGLMYFYLLRTFGEVPLKLQPTNTDKDIIPLEKSSKEQVADQIIQDLKFAVNNGVSSYPTMEEDRGRINKYAAYAILADVYLWTEQYQNCIDACNKIIESGRYRLLPKGTNQVTFAQNVYGNGNSIESVFEINFSIEKRNPFWNMFAKTSREFQANDWVAEGGLFGVDLVDQNNRDVRGNGTSFSEATGNISKYTIGGITEATSTNNWIVYKYADVLLMKAEALTFLSEGNIANGTEAIGIVNDLRDHRNALSSTTNGLIEIPEPDETKKIGGFILEERARECAFEGKRWYDILRFAKRNNYRDIDLLISIVSANALPSKQQIVINKYKDQRSHYLPIYYTELQTNKLLVQNSFY